MFLRAWILEIEDISYHAILNFIAYMIYKERFLFLFLCGCWHTPYNPYLPSLPTYPPLYLSNSKKKNNEKSRNNLSSSIIFLYKRKETKTQPPAKGYLAKRKQ